MKGLIEIIGLPSIGKTTYAILLSKPYYTLLLLSKNEYHILHKNVFIRVFLSFEELLFFIFYKATEKIRKLKIQFLIIDSLNMQFINQEKSELIKLVIQLKKIIYYENIKIIVINTVYDEENLFVYRLSKELLYHFNTRIMICRNGKIKEISSYKNKSLN